MAATVCRKSPAQLGFFNTLIRGQESSDILFYAIFIRLKDDYLSLCARFDLVFAAGQINYIVIVPEGEKIIDVGDVFKSYAGTAIVHGDDRFRVQRDSGLYCLLRSDRVVAADGDHENVERLELCRRFGGECVPQIAQMRDTHALGLNDAA